MIRHLEGEIEKMSKNRDAQMAPFVGEATFGRGVMLDSIERSRHATDGCTGQEGSLRNILDALPIASDNMYSSHGHTVDIDLLDQDFRDSGLLGQHVQVFGGTLTDIPSRDTAGDKKTSKLQSQENYEDEIEQLRSQLQIAESFNETMKDELRIYETLDLRKSIGIQNSPKLGSCASQTGPSESAQQGPVDLTGHLEEIRALRTRLEQSIQQNDELRKHMEKRLLEGNKWQKEGENYWIVRHVLECHGIYWNVIPVQS